MGRAAAARQGAHRSRIRPYRWGASRFGGPLVRPRLRAHLSARGRDGRHVHGHFGANAVSRHEGSARVGPGRARFRPRRCARAREPLACASPPSPSDPPHPSNSAPRHCRTAPPFSPKGTTRDSRRRRGPDRPRPAGRVPPVGGAARARPAARRRAVQHRGGRRPARLPRRLLLTGLAATRSARRCSAGCAAAGVDVSYVQRGDEADDAGGRDDRRGRLRRLLFYVDGTADRLFTAPDRLPAGTARCRSARARSSSSRARARTRS